MGPIISRLNRLMRGPFKLIHNWIKNAIKLETKLYWETFHAKYKWTLNGLKFCMFC
ncbi:Hypothetical protein BSM4216_1204 [Bacillus smithii]|nr:Hypothetical protein BSM4216_1204 [Bacillus smithii]